MTITKENTACLIFNSEFKFLLIQRNSKDASLPGFWELPSGGIDEGEEKEDSVIRETLEEVGIDISECEFKQVDSEKYSFTKENGDIKNVTETTFLVRIEGKVQVVLSDEHVDYQWISLEDLDNVFDDKEDLIYRRVNRIFKEYNLQPC